MDQILDFEEKQETEPLIYATFGERLLALIIDYLILLIPVLIFTYGIQGTLGKLLNLITGTLYVGIMESGKRQATFGKSLIGIKVCDERTHGRISFMQALGRRFGKWVSFLILLIGYFMMLWDDKNQTLHDKMAGTLIVKD